MELRGTRVSGGAIVMKCVRVLLRKLEGFGRPGAFLGLVTGVFAGVYGVY